MEFLKYLLTAMRGVWLLPFILTLFVLLSLLLFVGELPEHMRRYILPSLVVFLIGLGHIIFCKELWQIRYKFRNRECQEEEKLKNPNFPNMPGYVAWGFFAVVMGWFIAFIAYNIWRGVF